MTADPARRASPDDRHSSSRAPAVPISVQLGAVVPPEDPEDWRRPLTWVAAAGMVVAPVLAGAWFWLAPPPAATPASPGAWVIGGLVVIGAVITGTTQIGPVRAFAGTLGAALFAALLLVGVGAAFAGERPIGAAPPTLAQGFVAASAGVAGSLAASTLAPVLSAARTRLRRGAAPAAVGLAVTALVLRLIGG